MMHCKNVACDMSFNMGLTSVEGQKLECFKSTTNNIIIATMNIYCIHFVIKSFWYFISTWLSLCECYHLYGLKAMGFFG